MKFIIPGLLALLYFSGHAYSQNFGTISPKQFQGTPFESGVHTWWHWIDGNITKDGIRKDLEAMHSQGITQATILNVGLFHKQFFGLKEVRFNSPEWYAMFQYALEKADSLGLKIGVHNCDGWSTTGGPWIDPEHAMKEVTWNKTIINGGKHIEMKLSEPYSFEGFYRDVAVLAIKSDRQANSFVQAEPIIKFNDEEKVNYLSDACPVGGMLVKKEDTITIEFNEEFEAEKVAVHPRKSYVWGSVDAVDNSVVSYSLEALNQNNTYERVLDFKTTRFNKTRQIEIPPVKSKSYRLIINSIENTESFFIGELEFLKENESPSFTAAVPNFQTKTVSVQGSAADQYFTPNAYTCGSIQLKDIIDLTSKVDLNGILSWDAPAGNWEIIRFGYTITGVTNRPATESGLGLECDKMDTVALNIHYANFPKKLIEHAGAFTGNTFKFLLIDSWECYFQNWTSALPAEFEKINGYSLTPWIPTLCGEVVESSESTESFYYDFRRTIAKLIEENYYKHYSDLCHRDGLELHGEVIYGGSKLPPIDVLKAYSYTDMPMFEFWARPDKNSLYGNKIPPGHLSQFASSAGLFYEKPSVGSEAYTGNATYSATPWDLVPFGDVAYTSGISQMILHSYVHQPVEARPGLTLQNFGLSFNRNNTIWNHLSGWMNFQARIQYILQSSQEANDILVYVGDALPQFTVDATQIPRGYKYNVCNSDILINKLRVENHKIKTENGATFSLLLLPRQEGMNYSTLIRLAELLKQGAFIYGEKPSYLYSLADRKHAAEFYELIEKIWGSSTEAESKITGYGKGKVFSGMSLKEAIKKINLKPDFEVISGDSKDFIFSHRHNESAELYFVANLQNHPVTASCKFRAIGNSFEIWDPLWGKITSVIGTRDNSNSTVISYDFKPLESVFFVIEKNRENLQFQPKATVTDEFEITEFEGSIEFFPAYDTPIEKIELSEYLPLSAFENPAIKYFAGQVKYTLNFNFPENADNTKNWFLKTGNLNGAASLSLNGQELENVWSPLQELPINNSIKTGDNKLEITIDIPYRNRFVGDFMQYGEVKSLWTTCEIGKYLNDRSPLLKVGLTEPLKIIAKTK
ncbi:glycosyl hydrolase [Maribellus sediminis]|uniref:glycosyl hydrolase n=1 Tax=Maribellus sediminis TaxID=2696285 RepID=UPI0014309798|nr:glycosyl hydrolase [Maribellus sediminis]